MHARLAPQDGGPVAGGVRGEAPSEVVVRVRCASENTNQEALGFVEKWGIHPTLPRLAAVVGATSGDSYGRRSQFHQQRHPLAGLDVMSRLLDNVAQGLLVADASGMAGAERSEALNRWFGPLSRSESIFSYFAKLDTRFSAWLEVSWSAVFEDVLPIDVSLAQLPQRFMHLDRHYSVTYRPITASPPVDARVQGAPQVSAVLIVVTDVTEIVTAERAWPARGVPAVPIRVIPREGLPRATYANHRPPFPYDDNAGRPSTSSRQTLHGTSPQVRRANTQQTNCDSAPSLHLSLDFARGRDRLFRA